MTWKPSSLLYKLYQTILSWTERLFVDKSLTGECFIFELVVQTKAMSRLSSDLAVVKSRNKNIFAGYF